MSAPTLASIDELISRIRHLRKRIAGIRSTVRQWTRNPALIPQEWAGVDWKAEMRNRERNLWDEMSRLGHCIGADAQARFDQ